MTLPLPYTSLGAGRVIVFLHGAIVGKWMWYPQETITGYRLVFVELPGYGRNGPGTWVSMDDAADRVAATIRDIAPGGEKIFLVGLSLGGDVGLRVLARHPGLIERAFLTGIITFALPWWIQASQQALAFTARLRVVHRAFANGCRLPADRRDAYYADGKRIDLKDFRKQVREIFRGTPLDGLATCTVPTLLVGGEKEPKQAQRSAVIAAGLMPHGTAVIAQGVNHGWSAEAPAFFNAAILAWFAHGETLPELRPA